ncbi:UTRA domain-containing protein [Streptomyces sp. NPDC054866]
MPAPELYAALTELDHELHFTEYIRTRIPLPDQAQALRLPEGVPLLHIIRVTLTAAEKPLSLEEFHLPGDDLELFLQAVIDSPVDSDFLYRFKAPNDTDAEYLQAASWTAVVVLAGRLAHVMVSAPLPCPV